MPSSLYVVTTSTAMGCNGLQGLRLVLNRLTVSRLLEDTGQPPQLQRCGHIGALLAGEVRSPCTLVLAYASMSPLEFIVISEEFSAQPATAPFNELPRAQSTSRLQREGCLNRLAMTSSSTSKCSRGLVGAFSGSGVSFDGGRTWTRSTPPFTRCRG